MGRDPIYRVQRFIAVSLLRQKQGFIGMDADKTVIQEKKPRRERQRMPVNTLTDAINRVPTVFTHCIGSKTCRCEHSTKRGNILPSSGSIIARQRTIIPADKSSLTDPFASGKDVGTPFKASGDSSPGILSCKEKRISSFPRTDFSQMRSYETLR